MITVNREVEAIWKDGVRTGVEDLQVQAVAAMAAGEWEKAYFLSGFVRAKLCRADADTALRAEWAAFNRYCGAVKNGRLDPESHEFSGEVDWL